MKKNVLILSLIFVVSAAISQVRNEPRIPMIGDEAPAFQGISTQGNIDFPKDFGKHWKIIFSHPRNFTPVCTSEILELGYLQQDFADLDAKLIVISTDTKERHEMWKSAMEETTYNNNKPVKLNFPLVDDSKMTISHSYGMLHNRSSSTENVRGVYIIGPDNTIKATIFYPMSIGRNMDEIKRAVMALQTADDTNLLTPANWNPGDDLLVPFYPYTEKELEKNPALKDQFYEVNNLMWFKKM
jgi:peroxiredoxin (alkyl hydroperoxide reductase subunit C)